MVHEAPMREGMIIKIKALKSILQNLRRRKYVVYFGTTAGRVSHPTFYNIPWLSHS
jgi:hypothetical protein